MIVELEIGYSESAYAEDEGMVISGEGWSIHLNGSESEIIELLKTIANCYNANVSYREDPDLQWPDAMDVIAARAAHKATQWDILKAEMGEL